MRRGGEVRGRKSELGNDGERCADKEAGECVRQVWVWLPQGATLVRQQTGGAGQPRSPTRGLETRF
jgi:hypothetical protein